MQRNRSVPTDSVLPHVVYRDLAKAIEWLTETFGYVENYRYGIRSRAPKANSRTPALC